MRWKHNEATYQLDHATKINATKWIESKKTLQKHRINRDFNQIWQTEKDRIRENLKKKRKRKINHLAYKQTNQTKPQDYIEGITVKDQPIDNKDYNTEPRIYGSTTDLDENQIELLNLPPKFAIFQPINMDAIQIEAEVAMTKIRRKRTFQGENDENSDRIYPITEINNTTRIDMREMRPTDLKFNKRVIIPDPLPQQEEIELQELKQVILNTAKTYKQEKEHCDQKLGNLTNKEREGLKSLKKIKDDIIISQTDKSGRFSVDSVDNYIEATRPHFENDPIVTEEYHLQVQKEMNAHSTFWINTLQISHNLKSYDVKRTKMAFKINNHSTAPLTSLRKDHKSGFDEKKGPPTRPVCGANEGYNSKLSHLISSLIRPIWTTHPNVCCSTEDMMAAIKKVNNRLDNDELIVGSADVSALYPSLDIDHTARITAEKFLNSNIEILGIDNEELGLYLALNLPAAQLNNLKINHLCPTRKTHRGRPPTITGCATATTIREQRYKPWNPRSQTPNEKETKKMLSIALEIIIKQIMTSHIYEFQGELRKQTKGGPIGLDLTGDLAQIYMIWYDEELQKKLQTEGIEIKMYQRYVDDINLVIKKPTTEIQEPENRDISILTMEKVRTIGGTIHNSIKLQTDTPLLHKEKKMPILDLHVWCEKRKTIDIHNKAIEKNLVLHSFYSKPMATKHVMHSRTAMPDKMKKTVLTQEMLRAILRCSPELKWEEKIPHCNKVTKKMQFSGHSQQFRTIVTKSAIKAYKEILKKDEEGTEPMYRDKFWDRENRNKKKRAKLEGSWYKSKGAESKGAESVMFIPATPGSELKRRVEANIKDKNVKIKIVEKGGQTLRSILKRQKQIPKEQANQCNCLICKSGGKPGECRQEGAIYQITCNECNDSYVGESGINAYTRINQHLEAEANTKQHKDSVLHRHQLEKHNNHKVSYDAEVLTTYQTSALRRQVAESVYINKIEHGRRINNALEWNTRSLPQLTIEGGRVTGV